MSQDLEFGADQTPHCNLTGPFITESPAWTRLWFHSGSGSLGMPQELVALSLLQPPVGHSHQGRHAKVPEPHEPLCCGSGCAGAKCGWSWPAAQPPTPQHRVGPARLLESGESGPHVRVLSRPYLSLVTCLSSHVISLQPFITCSMSLPCSFISLTLQSVLANIISVVST